ncbi:MAG TPA: hypothetical protein VKE40_07130 [Gemmataceae bacterium]|nr:hypothetical protein [Gemmataceae bacterium]
MGNRNKLAGAFGEGAFGLPDVPVKVGHRREAGYEWRGAPIGSREDRRSWKRRRKTKWRPK